MDYSEMRAFQFREENGFLPDDVYVPTREDLDDPDHDEIAALVVEQYDHDNARRRDERMRNENLALRNVLAEHGIDIDF